MQMDQDRAGLTGKHVGGFDPVNMQFVPTPQGDMPEREPASSRAGWPDVSGAVRLGRLARLALRPWRMDDLDRFHALLDAPEVWTYMPAPYPDPLTPEAARDLLTLSIESPHHDVMAVLWDGVAVGQVRLEFTADQEAEISYWLGQAYWGNGIAQMAVESCLRQLPQRFPHVTRVTARVHEENPASHVVVMRAGLAKTSRDDKAPDWVWYVRDLRSPAT